MYVVHLLDETFISTFVIYPLHYNSLWASQLGLYDKYAWYIYKAKINDTHTLCIFVTPRHNCYPFSAPMWVHTMSAPPEPYCEHFQLRLQCGMSNWIRNYLIWSAIANTHLTFQISRSKFNAKVIRNQSEILIFLEWSERPFQLCSLLNRDWCLKIEHVP